MLTHLNFHIHARRQAEVCQRINRLGRCLQDVNEPLMHPHFKLFPAVLMDKS